MENKTIKKIFLMIFICFIVLVSFNIAKAENGCNPEEGEEETTSSTCVPTAEICGDGEDQDCDGHDKICVVEEPETNECTETDGGKDYYTKGKCVSSTGAVRTDYCLEDGVTLKEFFCWSDDLVYNEPGSKIGYICKDGALVKEETPLPDSGTDSNGETPTGETGDSPDSERPDYCPKSKYPYSCEKPKFVAPSDASRCMTGDDNIEYSSKPCVKWCNIKYYTGDKYNILSCIDLEVSDCNCREKLPNYGCGPGGRTCYGWKKVCGDDDSDPETIADSDTTGDDGDGDEEDGNGGDDGDVEIESTGKCYCAKTDKICIDGYYRTETECTGTSWLFWKFTGTECCEKVSESEGGDEGDVDEGEEEQPPVTEQTGCPSKYIDECSNIEVCPQGSQCISGGKTYCDTECKKLCSMTYAPELEDTYTVIWCRKDTECECQEKVEGNFGCFQAEQSCYGAKIGCTPSEPPPDDVAPPEPVLTHKECSNGQCIVINGEGQDECNEDDDCAFQLPEEEHICTDSDSGKNYFEKGTTSGRSWVDDDTPILRTDFCVALTGSPAVLSQCSGDNCGVYEFECVTSYDKPFVDGNIQPCEYGCKDGACLEEPTEPTGTMMKINGNYIILNENFPDDVYSPSIYFYTGVLPTGKIVRTLINFDLSGLKGKEIRKAELVINKISMLYEQEYGKQLVGVHKVTGPWDTTTACWNNQPRFDTTVISSKEITEDGRYAFDIISIIDYLIEHEAGVLLKAENEEEINLKKFDNVYLNIRYVEGAAEPKNCGEMGGRCRFLFGCRRGETEADYKCSFWSKCCVPD